MIATRANLRIPVLPGPAVPPPSRLAGPEPARPPRPPESPRRFGRYLLLRTVGSGGMGVVYEAYDPQVGQRVALKVLRAGLPDESKATQRFLREAQALAAIQHPRIVAIRDIGIEGEVPFISMDLLDGQSLEERMDSALPFRFSEIHRIARQISEGLDQIHAVGLIHRDIKPGNVWLSEPGAEVVLLDFGLARRIEGQLGLTATSLMIGTPHYLSPEHARGEPLDARCDLFSLGVILYELAAGKKPFEGGSPLALVEQICRHNPPRVSAINPAMPATFSNLVMELLAKYPKDRPASAAAVLRRLAAIDPDAPIPAPSSRPDIAVSPPASEPHRPLLGWFNVACVLLIGSAVWLWTNGQRPGHLEIEAPDATAEVEVWDGTRRVATATAYRPLDLPPGSYHLTLAHPLYGSTLSETDVRVPPAGQKVVRVLPR